jgi:hypothetical protein
MMPNRLQWSLAVVVIFLGHNAPCQNEKMTPPPFPTANQINLVITQAVRAVSLYENAVNQEQTEFGVKSGVEQDRQVLKELREYLPRFEANPQLFNTPVGFLLIVTLDDASRNMALCMSQAASIAAATMVTDVQSAKSKLALMETCNGVNALLYTISENAVDLYQNYLVANALLQQKETKTIDQCMEIIKTRCSGAAKHD